MKYFFNIVINLPICFLALFSQAKSFKVNPMIGNACFNRLGLQVIRVKFVNRCARFLRLFLKNNLTKQKQLEYQRNGFIVDSNFLDPFEFHTFRKEVFESKWLLREMRQGNTVTRRVFLNEFSLKDKSPKLYSFIRNADLISKIRYIAGFGGEQVFSIQVIFSQLDEVAGPQAAVHADTFHSNAKAWFFLEDVGKNDSPFAYMRGSHRLTPERLIWEKKQSITAKNRLIIYHVIGSFRVQLNDLL